MFLITLERLLDSKELGFVISKLIDKMLPFNFDDIGKFRNARIEKSKNCKIVKSKNPIEKLKNQKFKIQTPEMLN